MAQKITKTAGTMLKDAKSQPEVIPAFSIAVAAAIAGLESFNHHS
jgi:hypothetical protein